MTRAMGDPVYVIFTRNFFDKDGAAHGFRWSSVTGSAFYADAKAADLNCHPVAGQSLWEVSCITPEMLFASCVTSPPDPGP